jgi:hypothetical protein
MSTVDMLMADAFGPGKKRRSPEYQCGTETVLRAWLFKEEGGQPYAPGIAQFDAFEYGEVQGREIVNRIRKSSQGE